MTSGQTSLEQMLGVYKWVVDDVVTNMRDDFLNASVDTQVLEDLKQLWEQKLVQSGALSRPPKNSIDTPTLKDRVDQNKQQRSKQSDSTSVIQQAMSRTPVTVATGNTSHHPVPPPLIDTSQILIPSQHSFLTQSDSHSSGQRTGSETHTASPRRSQTVTNTGTDVLQTQSQTPVSGVSPEILAHQAAIYSAMTGVGVQPLMIPQSAGLSLPILQQGGIPYAAVQTANGLRYVPLPVALNLQQTVAAQQQQGGGGNGGRDTRVTQESTSNISQNDGPLPVLSKPSELPKRKLTKSKQQKKRKKDSFKLLERKDYQRRGQGYIVQLDGPGDDSSSEESEESSESEPEEEAPPDDDPLNSDDDADSDEDNVWETDNTIVCQFEKVYRVRSKWKFVLQDGIMNLKGHDYIFCKVNGEADW